MLGWFGPERDSIRSAYSGDLVMAQITIEIPDEIASRLSPYQERLPALISRWISVLEVSPSSSVELPSQSDSQVYQDIISFLLSQPDPQAILKL